MGKHRPKGWICEVDGCSTPGKVKGVCLVHYDRLRRYGQTEPIRAPKIDWIPSCGAQCHACGDYFVPLRRRKFCSDACCRKAHKQEADSARRQRIRANGGRQAFTIDALYLRGERTCHLCGYVVQAHERPQIDHVVPISKGGQHTLDNVRLVHGRCNSVRRDVLTPLYALVPA